MKKYFIIAMILCMGAWLLPTAAIANDNIEEKVIEEPMPEADIEAPDENALPDAEVIEEKSAEDLPEKTGTH